MHLRSWRLGRRLRTVYALVFAYGVVVHAGYLALGDTFADFPPLARMFANSLIVVDGLALLAVLSWKVAGRWVAAAVMIADAACNVWATFMRRDSALIERAGTVVIVFLAAGAMFWAASGWLVKRDGRRSCFDLSPRTGPPADRA